MIRRLLKNIKNRGLKDFLNPKRWGMFLRSQKVDIHTAILKDRVEALRNEYSEVFNDDNLLKQVAIRMSNEGCKPCLERGECVHCGCKTPDLFFEKGMECSGGYWFEMIPSENWKDYEALSGIEVSQEKLDRIRKYGKL